MSEPVTVSYSLEEMFSRLENKIDSNQKETNEKLKELSQKIDKQSEEITTIKATLQAQQPLIQKIPDLAEKVGELKNWRQIVLIVVTATVSGVIGWFIRGGTFKP
jgi:nucleotide-binding universal stress UspA family protein